MATLGLNKSFLFFTRYNLFSLICDLIPEIDKVFLQIPLNIYSEVSMSIIEAFLLLEWIGNQRPGIKTLKFIIKSILVKKIKVKKSKKKAKGGFSLQALINSTLRKQRAANFLNFLYLSILQLKQKFLSLKLLINKNSLFLTLTSFDHLVLRPEYLTNFYTICVYIYYNLTTALYFLGLNKA
jgi:hypothetical protein